MHTHSSRWSNELLFVSRKQKSNEENLNGILNWNEQTLNERRLHTHTHTYDCPHHSSVQLTPVELTTSSQRSLPHIALIVIAVSCIYKNYENFLLKRRWHFTEMQNSPAAVSDMQTDRQTDIHTERELDRGTYGKAERKKQQRRHSKSRERERKCGKSTSHIHRYKFSHLKRWEWNGGSQAGGRSEQLVHQLTGKCVCVMQTFAGISPCRAQLDKLRFVLNLLEA